MTIDEVINLVNATQLQKLTQIQELLLRYSWKGKTYTQMAEEVNYAENYLRKIAHNVWFLLSDIYEEPITKASFRRVLEERRLTPKQQLLIAGVNGEENGLYLPDYPGGPLSADCPFYIERPQVEKVAYNEISKPGSFLCVQGPKKMGKTSLSLRALAYAASLEYHTVIINFEQAEADIFQSIHKFLRWLVANICLGLNMQPKISEHWQEEIGSKVSCTMVLENEILSKINAPLFLVFKEINKVQEYPKIAKDFLPMLRYWHERSKQIKVWEKMRLFLVHSTEIDSSFDGCQLPWNIGRVLNLNYFTVAQVNDLVKRYGLDLNSSQIEDLVKMVGGHPYLIQLALYHLWTMEMTLEDILVTAPTNQGIYSKYLQDIANLVKVDTKLIAALKVAISAVEPVGLPSDLLCKLNCLGLVNLKEGMAEISCNLYRLYFLHEFNSIDTPPLKFSGVTEDPILLTRLSLY